MVALGEHFSIRPFLTLARPIFQSFVGKLLFRLLGDVHGPDNASDDRPTHGLDDQVDAGEVALLECRVTNLAAHHTVSWLR